MNNNNNEKEKKMKRVNIILNEIERKIEYMKRIIN